MQPCPEDTPNEPLTQSRDLCAVGEYHAAMRALPEVMRQWGEMTKLTGSTYEGAASFEFASTMFSIAECGDAEWGKILDDPAIPYSYKTHMIFEILEARLGKGAVYLGNKDNMIVPCERPAVLPREMMKLPEEHDGELRTAQPLPPAHVETPDYEDKNLRRSIKSLVAALGKKYDGDPRIGFITAGLLGTWGEWHTYPNSKRPRA